MDKVPGKLLFDRYYDAIGAATKLKADKFKTTLVKYDHTEKGWCLELYDTGDEYNIPKPKGWWSIK